MDSLPLFLNKKELFNTLLAVVILFCFSVSYEYYKYKKITSYSLHVATVNVINIHEKVSKKGKPYTVLKLKNSDFTFYTVSWKPLHVKLKDSLEVGFYTSKINFYNYLKNFYAPLKFVHIKSTKTPNIVVSFVQNQHIDKLTKELYSALYFATNISNDLRKDIAKWGISHLIAISGFHLTILSSILYFLLRPIYSFFQDRYFPYRNRSADLAFVVFAILGSYAYFIDFSPSVLRAFVLSLVAFFLYSKNIKIISFATLFFTMSIVLILAPKLFFSIAFWFSLSGVFYILLFLHHFSHLHKISIFLLLHFWVFALMLPIVHFVFDVFSFYQLLSPLLSMFFLLFYPLSLVLHVSGFGGVLDSLLVWFLSLHVQTLSLVTPLWFLCSYIILSFLAIRLKFVALVLPLLSLGLVLV